MSNLKEPIATLNKQFESIFSNSNEIDETVKYLKTYFQRIFIRRCIRLLIFLVILISIYLLIYYIPNLNWNASAIGRLALVKLILPAYNWQYLYNSRCLIEMPMSTPSEIIRGDDQQESTYVGLSDEECTVCESLGKYSRKDEHSCKLFYIKLLNIYSYISDAIDRISNTSFGNLNAIYLARDHPVIISDSHDVRKVPVDFIEFLLSLQHLRQSIPCNTVTNLLQIHRNEQQNLKRILEQTHRIGPMKEWFLHFRNCEFDAVKASRAIFSQKSNPYFMSNHLPPFRSSWILMSHQYDGLLNEKSLPVKDLVFVFQLKGKLAGRLAVQKKCEFLCATQDFQLNAGEALIFNAEMWDFFYSNNTSESHAESSLAVTFIQEIRAD